MTRQFFLAGRVPDLDGEHKMNVRSAFRIATIYFVFGALWIAASDHLVRTLFQDPQTVDMILLVKGWLFVAASAFLIYLLVSAELRRTSRVRETLHSTAEELEAIIQAAPVAILSLDLEGRVILWNPAAAQTFGWTEAEVLGKELPTVPTDGLDEFRQVVERVKRDERIQGMDLERVRKDGTRVNLLLSAAPLHDAGGRVRAIMAILLDVTEHRRLMEQFLHAQRLEAVGRFAGGIAHDFSNVLTAIDGTVQLALEEHDLPDTVRLDLLDVRQNVSRAAALTRQLLVFSRGSKAEPKVLDLNSLIRDLAGMLRRVVGPDVEIVTDLSSDLLPVRADPGQLEQVVTNLVVNARDAMPDGGRITIETTTGWRERPDGRGSGDVMPGRYTVLVVRDTGVGIPENIRDRIFEPFFTTKARDKGTGLGLSTVYGIVNHAGGSVQVESAPGLGTTFTIWLPAVEAPVEATEPTSQAGAARGRDPRLANDAGCVLVVEDDPVVRALMVRVLGRHGYHVVEAESGYTALEHAEGAIRPFDLVITDVALPGMSGPKLVRRLRERMPHLRVLVTSGYGRPDLADRVGGSGPVAFLEKPFTPAELLEKVRRIMLAGRRHADAVLSRR